MTPEGSGDEGTATLALAIGTPLGKGRDKRYVFDRRKPMGVIPKTYGWSCTSRTMNQHVIERAMP
jgi:hypothetical protein